MEKPKIKQVHLVAEMENGDIKQFGLTVKQRITLNEFAKQMGSEEGLALMNDSLGLILKSRCKKQVK